MATAVMATDTDASSVPTNSQGTDAPTPITSSGNDGTSRQGEDAGGFTFGGCWDASSAACLPSSVAAAVASASSQSMTSPSSQHCQKKRKIEDAELDPRLAGLCPTSRSIEELAKRSLDHFPCPDLLFPMPALEFDFRIAVALNPELSRSESRVHKEIITVTSGSWSGTFGNGRVLAGGYDLGQARGFRPIRIVEGAFVLQTDEAAPAVFEMRTRGSLSGPCNVLDVLLSPRKAKDIDPRQYSFRMFCTVKAADKRYAELVNCGLWVASGVWKGDQLIIDAFRVT
ncbi:Outer membrane protein, beta-barrel [Cordyceps fumosorosea ARSEF 2679]|uniref:Outer membrane protein, beta-barrel n=1 Tax=Cordyceps fumosorosea (strain ARSEF 2679) TaxID=1081104 RepID=A0A167TJG5_CORFA|nr:Outer membrane protein, beta-barrel [Cordyceps fumosorosea ARSEF 2679]OAA60660.1 Outer membrane protein, beta-barrel [Cordyceps fumosorosea ARSEF 2679]